METKAVKWAVSHTLYPPPASSQPWPSENVTTCRHTLERGTYDDRYCQRGTGIVQSRTQADTRALFAAELCVFLATSIYASFPLAAGLDWASGLCLTQQAELPALRIPCCNKPGPVVQSRDEAAARSNPWLRHLPLPASEGLYLHAWPLRCSGYQPGCSC